MSTESLGFMLQGVSQQQAKVRSSGQVTEQVNLLSDVNRGLTTRPATERLGAIDAITETGSKSYTVDIEGDLYRVVLETGEVPKVYGYDATTPAVTNPNAQQAYISTNAAVYVYDKTVYITNRDMLVETVAKSYTSEITENWGYIFCLGGLFTRKYTVDVTVGTQKVTASFTTPDGTTAGDAALTTTDNIVKELHDALVLAFAAATPAITTVTMTLVENHIRLVSSANNLAAVSTRDGEAGTLLYGDVSRVKTLADLPKFAAHGDYLFVYGAASIADDFWMRFEITGETVGSGFGKTGAWKEHFNVNDPSTLDPETMPHILTRNIDGTFTYDYQEWQHRRVGNEESNPTPSFVGFAIRDIREFQGRLTFATSGATVVCSRTDYPTDFYRKSATTVVDTDPVDQRATMEGTKPFDWLVPFDRDLFVLAANAQYVISGAGGLTGGNSGIVLATNYDMSSEARPQPTGRTLLFPFKGQRYAGVNEYFTGNNYASTSVDNLTKTASKYIDGEIREIISSSNDGVAVFLTDRAYAAGIVYVYKYLWEFDKKTQSAWGTWKFPGRVKHCHVQDGVLYVWYTAVFGEFDLEEYVCRCNLDIPDNSTTGYALALDDILTAVVPDAATFTITSTQAALKFAAVGVTTDLAYSEVVPSSVAVSGMGATTRYQYIFDLAERSWLIGATLVYGQTMERYVDPTPPIARDRLGNARSDVQIVVRAYYIDYADTGQFAAQMISKFRGNNDMANTDWFPMDDDPEHPFEESVRTGTLQVPWGEYSNFATLRVYSDDIRPTTIQEIRYEPEYLKAGG